MTDKLDMDAFPCILENPSDFRKGSGDYGIILAVQVKHVDQIKPLMVKAQKSFAAFLVPMSSLDQAEAFIKAQGDNNSPQPPLSLRGGAEGGGVTDGSAFFATVEQMAAALGVDPRTVQLDADKGLVVRDGRGRYDTLASCGALRKALREAETGKNDAYNEERTAAMRLKRLEREREHEEAMKRLVNYEELLAARERKNADIKQKLLFLEKTLPPRLNALPANEQEPIIKHEIRKLLTEFAVAPVPGVGHRGGGQDLPAAAGPDRKPVGGRKKKARKQNKR